MPTPRLCWRTNKIRTSNKTKTRIRTKISNSNNKRRATTRIRSPRSSSNNPTITNNPRRNPKSPRRRNPSRAMIWRTSLARFPSPRWRVSRCWMLCRPPRIRPAIRSMPRGLLVWHVLVRIGRRASTSRGHLLRYARARIAHLRSVNCASSPIASLASASRYALAGE